MKKVLVIGLATALLSYSCNIFEKNERLLSEHTKSNGDKIKIYYVGLGATTSNVIQIRVTPSNRGELLIKAIENYDYLESSKLINDSLLQIVVNDSGYYMHKPDTIFVKVNE